MMQDSSRTREKKLGGGLRYISGINHFPLLAPLVVQGLRLNFESGIACNYFIWMQSLKTDPLLYRSLKPFFLALILQSFYEIPASQSAFSWNFAKKIGLRQLGISKCSGMTY